MTFIDGTVVNVALPALQADLHATITDVQWVVEAYALFLGALILVGGAMGDQLGRKRVETHRAGVASGINTTVSRVAGLLAIAVFGVLLSNRFDAEVQPRLDRLALPPATRTAIDNELPKMAGAELKNVAMNPDQRAGAQRPIDEAFVSGFRLVVIGSGFLALAAGAFGAAIRNPSRAITKAKA